MRKILSIVIVAVAMLAVFAASIHAKDLSKVAFVERSPSRASFKGNPEIDNYINGLQYDKNNILVYHGDSISNVPPNKQGFSSDEGYIVIERKKKSISDNTADLTVLNSLSNLIYPGALVKANGDLVDNQPTIIPAQRGAVVLSSDLPGMDGSDSQVRVSHAYKSRVNKGVSQLIERWNEEYAPKYPNVPARIQYEDSMAYSESQLIAKFGIAFKALNKELGVDFESIAEGKTQEEVVNLKQIYYTVNVNSPTSPSSFFGKDVTAEKLERLGVDSENPPAYISSVSYGRQIYVKLSTESKSLKVKEAFKAAMDGKTVHQDAEITNIINSSSFKALIYGGSAKSGFDVINGKLSDLKSILAESASFNRDNPGVPISYTTNMLKDNSLATIKSNAEYIETTSTIHKSGKINLDHSGGYVAQFYVNWDEYSYDSEGNEVVTHKTWDKNGKGKCAHFNESIYLPGNARNINIVAQECTGLAWDWWRTVVNEKKLPLAPNINISIWGTTLHPQKSVIIKQ